MAHFSRSSRSGGRGRRRCDAQPSGRPEGHSDRAFKSITAEGQLNPSEEIFGTKELEKLLQKGSAQTGMELSMTGISDESLNQMSGAGIGLDVKRDVDSGRQLLNLSLQYGGGELADAQLYMDDTQIWRRFRHFPAVYLPLIMSMIWKDSSLILRMRRRSSKSRGLILRGWQIIWDSTRKRFRTRSR